MPKYDHTRFVVAQGRFHPYFLAGAHMFMQKNGSDPKNVSNLLHSLTEMLTIALEQELGCKLFENNEEALDYCASHLSISTRLKEVQRVKTYQKAITKLIPTKTLTFEEEINLLVAQGMTDAEAIEHYTNTHSAEEI